MMRTLLIISILTVNITTRGVTQDVPLSQKLIEEGYGYLKGWYYQGTPKDAKKLFNRAKLIFFYNKSVVNDANIGLSEYYLVIKDTLKSINILKRILGSTTTKSIEANDFSKLSATKKDDWGRYYATSKLIQVLIAMEKFNMSKSYLKYLKEYIHVTWNCGSGTRGHTIFIEETEKTLKKNGY